MGTGLHLEGSDSHTMYVFVKTHKTIHSTGSTLRHADYTPRKGTAKVKPWGTTAHPPAVRLQEADPCPQMKSTFPQPLRKSVAVSEKLNTGLPHDSATPLLIFPREKRTCTHLSTRSLAR